MNNINVQVEVIPVLSSSSVPGFTLSPAIVVDFAAYGTDTALVTLSSPDGITGVLQGGLIFENPATWGSVWPTSTEVPNQGYGIMTHLFVPDLALADIVTVLSDTQLVVKDPTGTLGILGLNNTVNVMDANYKVPRRVSLTSGGDWWLGSSGDVYIGTNGQTAGFVYVVDGPKPYIAVAGTADITAVVEY